MSLSSALSATGQGTRTFLAPAPLAATGSCRDQRNQEASDIRGSATMITLAATAVSEVVVAIGNTAAATSPATAEPMAATSGLPAAASASATTTTSAAAVTAVAAVGTTTNMPTSGILGSSSSSSNRTNPMTTRPASIKRRHKVKEFNDLISCSLCSGYLINATTIDHCGHSYCRTCIVRHCKNSKHCPKCGKQISLSNLRNDEKLKALVYKLVPGLYHDEIQRQLQFSLNEGKDEAVSIDPEEDYFSPVEPISLSLEYHPDSLANYNKDLIPQVRYLQCPAAVTVHHLQRLISSKFNIDMENGRVDIEIIYEDKILPDNFSLMDVGYCYSWKRDSPMRFFYRILVHSACNSAEQVTSTSDKILDNNNTEDKVEAKCTKKTKDDSNHIKTVHFEDESKEPIKKHTTVVALASKIVKNEKVEQTVDFDDEDDDDVSTIDDSYKNSKTTYAILKPKPIKHDDMYALGHNNNNGISHKHRKDDQQKESVKVTIITRKTVTNVETKSKSGKNKAKRSSSPKTPDGSISNDFKSLRSNDVRYMNDYSAAVPVGNGKSHKSKSAAKEGSKPATPKCDIIVSIPPSGHRSSNSSDDSSENLSLAQLKTASKKNNNVLPLKQSVSMDESLLSKPKATKFDVPKLKITVPKKSPTIKTRKLSAEEPQTEHVDLTTYAKHIGLKPINQTAEEKKEIKLKISPGNSPSSSLSSSSASSPPSAADSGFVFTTNSSSHKKRKKAKHSKEHKEPGSKKRRLHAEISSPAAEDLKLTVKLTGNHTKTYKAERKVSTSSDEVIITSPIVTTAPSLVVTSTSTAVSSTTNNSHREEKKPISPKLSINIAAVKKAQSETINNIPSVNKTSSDVKTNKEVKVAKEAVLVKTTYPAANAKPSSPVTLVNTNNSVSASSVATAKQLHLPKIHSIQDTKLPASPPLPPSLFKTAPMALQPISLPSPKLTQSSGAQQPKLGLTTPDTNNLVLNRPSGAARPPTTFAIPNPPRALPMSPKLSPISTIASAANRQAQLKRSASLDGSPSSLPKQQRIDQDKVMRKPSYTPFLGKIASSPATAATSPAGNGMKPQQKHSPIVISTNNSPKPVEQSYYTSTMANSYTREIQTKKQTPIMLPPSSISVTKMPDVITGNMVQSPAGLTITPQQQTPLLQPHIQQQKPALEIVRIQSSIPPIDQQKLPITNNNTAKPSPPKTTRPPPPTIPLVKIKRSTNQTNSLKTTLTTVTAPVQQKAVLSLNSKKSPIEVGTTGNGVNGVNKRSEQKTGESGKDANKKVGSPKGGNVCDTTGVLDLSGKSSRSPSHDKASPPLTPLSVGQTQAQLTPNSTLTPVKPALKQQTVQSSPSTTTPKLAMEVSSNLSGSANSVCSAKPVPKSELVMTDTSSKPISPMSPISTTSLNSSSLQNLKLLSESATSREKITIKSQRPLAPMPKLNEISKVRQPIGTVRQQNASVRNIPNPSALTLRGQQVPMLTSISKTTTNVSKTTTTVPSTIASSAAARAGETKSPGLAPSNDVKLAASTTANSSVSPTTFTSTLAKPSSPAVSTTSASSADASKLLVSKKNLHLEQLAASLNMRAAAAAGETSSKSTLNSTSLAPSSAATTSATLTTSVMVSSSSTTLADSSTASPTTPTVSCSSASGITTSSSVVSTTTSAPVISATTK